MKNIRIFYLKIFIFGVKFSVYLNGHVFVMTVECADMVLEAPSVVVGQVDLDAKT